MEYFENNFIAPPNNDKIVMWRFLHNRRLILRLQFSGHSHIGRIARSS